MKKYLAVIIFFCFAIPASAQKNYLDKVVDSTCKCLEAAKGNIKTAAAFDNVGQACIIKAAGPYLDSFSRDENIPIEDLDDKIGEKIGRKIGMKLVGSCPVFMDLMALYSEEEEDKDIVKGTTTGLVTGVQITDHVYIEIKEPSGKITKVVWLQYFPGADAYKSSPSKLKGKQVEVEWKQEGIYFIAKKDFDMVKAITRLNMN